MARFPDCTGNVGAELKSSPIGERLWLTSKDRPIGEIVRYTPSSLTRIEACWWSNRNHSQETPEKRKDCKKVCQRQRKNKPSRWQP